MDKKFAYNKDGNVFYDVKHFNDYGKLSGKNIEDLESGARIEINEEKSNPLDFSFMEKSKSRRALLGKSVGQRSSRLAY